jgi:hypothetical protein
VAEITAAIDEVAANDLFDFAIAAIPPQSTSGSGNLGPFAASYSVSATLSNGDVDLIVPGTIRIVDLRLDWNMSLVFEVDLSDFLPDFCLPQVCVDIPCVGEVCTPGFCVDWPTISIPVSFGDFVKATGDLGIATSKVGPDWHIDAVVQSIGSLQFGPATAGILLIIGAAVTPVLLLVPFIGPFLAVAFDAILAVITIAGLTGFLGPILSPFLSGMHVRIYDQPVQYVVLPAESAVDPEVHVTIDAIGAEVQHNGTEDELVLSADISP